MNSQFIPFNLINVYRNHVLSRAPIIFLTGEQLLAGQCLQG